MSITAIDAVRALGYRDQTIYVMATGEIKWKDGHETTEEEASAINAKITELQAEYNSKQYQRDRLAEYPSIQELVVALYDEEDKASIIEKRNAVKAKYPKPE